MMKKKEYISPETVVIAVGRHAHLLSGSKGVSGLNNNEGFNWKNDGIDDEEYDR